MCIVHNTLRDAKTPCMERRTAAGNCQNYMKEKRIKRIKHFESFYDKSKEIFETLRDNDSRADIFEKEYMLCVCPGSRAGGQEKRIVEVFWGARLYEFETKEKSWKSLTETGVTLFIYRNDTGHITVSLSPAKTEYMQPIEDSITIYKWLDPKKLNDDKFLKSLWNDFIAYMEYTSLDGTPSFGQKLRISYLKNIRNLVIDKKWQPTKVSVFSKDVLKFVLTVGLSGFVFFIVSVLREPDENVIQKELETLNKNIEVIQKQLENGAKNGELILGASKSIDSLNIKLIELNESTINNNQEGQLKKIEKKLIRISGKLDKLRPKEK